MSSTQNDVAMSPAMRAFLEYADQHGDPHGDPLELIEDLEAHAESPFLTAYAELVQTCLGEHSRPVYAFLDQHVEGFCVVEASVREAGFVLGFEYAWRLLVGQGGAR